MRKTLLVALFAGTLVCMLAADSLARGGRGARGGVVMGPYGPLYDTRSPEWRMSGGNIFAYQQLMQTKMMVQRQQFMMKQMQAAQKLQAAQDKTKAADKSKGAAADKGKADAQSTQPQSPSQLNQPVWLDEFGRPIVNHYRRPRNRAPASKPAVEKPAPEKPTTRRDALRRSE